MSTLDTQLKDILNGDFVTVRPDRGYNEFYAMVAICKVINSQKKLTGARNFRFQPSVMNDAVMDTLLRIKPYVEGVTGVKIDLENLKSHDVISNSRCEPAEHKNKGETTNE